MWSRFHRIFSRTLSLLALALLLGSRIAAGDEFGREGNLEIFIRSDKPVYTFGEPVVLTLTLKNNTNESLFVNRRFNASNDLRWEIFLDPDGFLTVRPGPDQKPSDNDYILLKPGEEIEKVFPNLAEIVQEKLRKGLYGLRITYFNRDQRKGPRTWTGEIVSNRLS
ncbi:MAG TPA: hypothetical protein VIK48_05985, partial [Candidatus Manganitrophaceae bacterium]